MTAYYNENDPRAAAWLRELIAAGHIAPGDVDQRSIIDVSTDDLRGYRQCHFFAGIGGWSYALRLAGWPDNEPIWTGSCPCQPLSCAGQRKGHADERHLWPAFYRLIAECRPPTVFGEQVASKDGREWLAGVRADLEALGYAVGGADLCAASIGAPHIRQRLYWMADAECNAAEQGRSAIKSSEGNGTPCSGASTELGRRGDACGMGHPSSDGRESTLIQSGVARETRQKRYTPQRSSSMARPDKAILCLDGKSRRVEPGIFPLVDGLPRGVVSSGDPGAPEYANATAEARMMRLRGYGNAINPVVAAEFICAALKPQRGET